MQSTFLSKLKPIFFPYLLGLLGVFFLVHASAFAAEDEAELQSSLSLAEATWGKQDQAITYLGLEDALARALVHNREIKMKRQDLAKAKAKLKEADVIGRPVLEYEEQLGPAPRDTERAIQSFFSGDITVLTRSKIGLGVPLTTFGKVQLAKELAQNGITAVGYEQTKKESEVIFKVKQLYYGVLLAREVNRLVEYSTKGANKEIKKREDEDGGDPVELLKLKLFRSDMEKKLSESQRKEIMALAALRVLLGMDSTQNFDIKQARLAPVPNTLKNFAYYRQLIAEDRADVKLLAIGAQSRELNKKLEKRFFAPDLGLGAFFEMGRAPGVKEAEGTNDFNDPFNYTRAGVGVQLKGKLDYAGRKAKIQQAEADQRRTELEVELAKEGILLEVKQAYLNVKAALEELARAEESSKMARQVLFLTQSNVDIGLAESKDLIEGVSKFLLTRGDYFKSVFDLNVAFAELDQKLDQRAE